MDKIGRIPDKDGNEQMTRVPNTLLNCKHAPVNMLLATLEDHSAFDIDEKLDYMPQAFMYDEID